MDGFPFRPDRKLTDILNTHPFTVSAEIIPPRNGAEQGQVLAQIASLIDAGTQFLSVTKGAGGSLRGGSLPIAQAIKERFAVPCIAHFTCRDLAAVEVENQLIDHHYFGIRNILALRGDPPDGQADWAPQAGGYQFAHELISQITTLNRGLYLKRVGGPAAAAQEPTDFCIGAAVYPEHPDEGERIEFFRKKVQAGAHYGITDMLFDSDAYARFRDLAARHGLGIPVLPGTRILKSRKQAEKMMAKFRVRVPSEILSKLPESDSPAELGRGIELFHELVERLKRLGAPGIHVFVIVDTGTASLAIRELMDRQKECGHSGAN